MRRMPSTAEPTKTVATWRYAGTSVDFDTAYADIRRLLLKTF